MRIAFVGKGGSGKSTITASFAGYVAENTKSSIAVFDADLNIHIPQLLGFGDISESHHLSAPQNAQVIKQWLKGNNEYVDLSEFKKTTPPTRKSQIVHIEHLQKTPLNTFAVTKGALSVFAIGTYQEDGIGASCYHNNLAIFESILNHTDDTNAYLIADMVAGIDSFAGTLHAQFDLTCVVVEPTLRSIEVYKKYCELAKQAGVLHTVFAIGNKTRDQKEKDFIAAHIDADKIIGFFDEDPHVREVDQMGGILDTHKLTENNQLVLNKVLDLLNAQPDNRDARLKKIWELHKTYISQGYILKQHGDLSGQIDPDFSFNIQ